MTAETASATAPSAVTDKLIEIVDDFLEDFDEEIDEAVTRESWLLGDLGFESIDIIQLVVAIEEAFGKRNMGFEELLMEDGRYVDDLSVGQIADFVATRI